MDNDAALVRWLFVVHIIQVYCACLVVLLHRPEFCHRLEKRCSLNRCYSYFHFVSNKRVFVLSKHVLYTNKYCAITNNILADLGVCCSHLIVCRIPSGYSRLDYFQFRIQIFTPWCPVTNSHQEHKIVKLDIVATVCTHSIMSV
jgi:hypothetical protein